MSDIFCPFCNSKTGRLFDNIAFYRCEKCSNPLLRVNFATNKLYPEIINIIRFEIIRYNIIYYVTNYLDSDSAQVFTYKDFISKDIAGFRPMVNLTPKNVEKKLKTILLFA